MGVLQRKASEIEDRLFIQLCGERDVVVDFPIDREQMVINFLIQALYPWGSEKRFKLRQEDLVPEGVLDAKVMKLKGSLVHDICDELARLNNETAEAYLNSKLYVVLNKRLLDHRKKKKIRAFHPRDFKRVG